MNNMNGGYAVPDRGRMSGRISEIALSSALVVIPMLVFSASLLGLVFHYRVTHNGSNFGNLNSAGIDDESGVYYVDLSATLLIFIASWSSSLAPLLAGFVLTLASYPIARKFLKDARRERVRSLPTPYQLALILRFLNGGGFGALWSWLKYFGGWRNKRESQAKSLTNIAGVAVLATILGGIVFAADTWLHISTKTVEFIQVTPVSIGADYGIGLIPNCTVNNNTFDVAFDEALGCNVNPAASTTFLVNGAESIQVLNNLSDSVTVLTHDANPPYAYLSVPSSKELSQRDYTATTFSMQTQCEPISKACHLSAAFGASTPFKCTDAFQGDLTAGLPPNGIISEYFTDSTMDSNVTNWGVQNPYYFGLAALTNLDGGGSLAYGTPEIVVPVHGGYAFVLHCQVTVYDVTYDSVNGTITHFEANPSNVSTANVWQAPLAFTDVAGPYLEQAVSLATFSSTAQEVADKFALAYSKMALAIGAQAVTPIAAVAAQQRTSTLVTRIRAAPLFTLVAMNLLFVVLGVILTAVALGTSGGEVRDVQARLSVTGLVADRFEGLQARRRGVKVMEELFEENDGHGSMRIAVERNEEGRRDGGYSYKTWPRAMMQQHHVGGGY